MPDPIARLLAAIGARDSAAFGDCYAPDATLVEPLFPRAHIGRAEIVAGEQALFDAFNDVQPELTNVIADGPSLAVELVMRATNSGPLQLDQDTSIPATYRQIALPMVWLLDVDPNGLIKSERDYFDTGLFLRQLGLSD
jgi:ketosteroid isomerase-like protein